MLASLKKLWSLFTAAEKNKSKRMLALAVLMAAFETLGVISIMPFLSVLSRPNIIGEAGYLNYAYVKLNFTSSTDFIFSLGIASIALVLIASTFKTITQHLLNRFVQMQRHNLSIRLLSRYLHQPYEFFLTRNTAELSKNTLSEVDHLTTNIIQPMSQLIAQGVIVLSMGLLIFIYDPATALIVLSVVSALYFVIYATVRKRLGRIGKEVINENKERYTSCNEALNGIRDIKITQATNAYISRFTKASRTYARHLATNDTLSQTPLYLAEATGYTGLILISLYLLTRTNDLANVLPALGLYGFAAYRLLPAAQIMYRGVARLRFTSAALDNIHQDLILTEQASKSSQYKLFPKKFIRLENVQFAYPLEPNKNIFSGYSLQIPAYSIVGIKGKSGAGKSTLMDLLLGLVRPQKGTLWVDDLPIDANNINIWRNSIGYVPQHIYLADTSTIANIAFGVPENEIDKTAVERAAKTAQIHDFIVNELPQGYNSLLGERGIRLSGGQRQRIGIARALYRDPPVIFMDEATSALDEDTEKEFNSAISKISANKTIIIIAHRKATLDNCTTIINLESLTSSPSHSL